MAGGVGRGVEHADGPGGGEAAVVGADGALEVGGQGRVAGVPEEPDVFGGGDGWRGEEEEIDLGVGTEVEGGGGEGVDAGGEGVGGW